MDNSTHSHFDPIGRRPMRSPDRTSPHAKDVGTQHNAELPCWFPADSDTLNLPRNVRDSLAAIIAPAYRAFVLDVPGELERTIGNSVVYLSWLELLTQIRLANGISDSASPDAILHDPERLTDRYLQLMMAKCQAVGLALRVRVANETLLRPASPMNRFAAIEPLTTSASINRGDIPSLLSSPFPLELPDLPPSNLVNLESRCCDQPIDL